MTLLIFESRCRARQVEAAPPISNVSTFTRTIPRKFDVVSQTRVWQQHCRQCQTSHTTSLHMLSIVTARECPSAASSPPAHVSIEPPVVHSGVTSSLRHHNTENDPDTQLLLPLMEARNFRRHSVLRSDSAFVEVKSVTRYCSFFVDDFPTQDRENPDNCASK